MKKLKKGQRVYSTNYPELLEKKARTVFKDGVPRKAVEAEVVRASALDSDEVVITFKQHGVPNAGWSDNCGDDATDEKCCWYVSAREELLLDRGRRRKSAPSKISELLKFAENLGACDGEMEEVRRVVRGLRSPDKAWNRLDGYHRRWLTQKIDPTGKLGEDSPWGTVKSQLRKFLAA